MKQHLHTHITYCHEMLLHTRCTRVILVDGKRYFTQRVRKCAHEAAWLHMCSTALEFFTTASDSPYTQSLCTPCSTMDVLIASHDHNTNVFQVGVVE